MKLLQCKDASSKLRIVDSSIKNDGDVLKEFAANKIVSARFMDLTIVRDFTKPYPFMMPS